MGRVVPGTALTASIPQHGQSPAERECTEVFATGLRRTRSIRHHSRERRGLPAGSAPVRTTDSYQVRAAVAWQNQTGDCPSGIQNPVAYPERRSQTEAPDRQSVRRSGVPSFGSEIHSQAALHVSDRAGEDRVRGAGYLRNIIVIISELGLRYKKELLPMKKEHVDLDNGLIHIA